MEFNLSYKKQILFLSKLLVSGILVYFLINKISFTDIKKLTPSFAIYFLIAVTITLSAIFVMAYRWNVLVKGITKNKIKTYRLYRYYLKAMFFNIFLPGAIGGDVIRTRDLVVQHHTKIKTATIITLIERISGLYMLVLLGCFGVAFFRLPEQFKINIPHFIFYLVPVAGILCIPIFKWIISKKINIAYNIIMPVLIFSLLGQTGDILIAWIFSNYFNLAISFEQFLVIMPVVYVATVLPISLGGLGVREGTFVALLSFYQVDSSIAIMLSFMMFLVKVSIGIIGWAILLQMKPNEKSQLYSQNI